MAQSTARRLILGVDIGEAGAIAVLDSEGRLLEDHDMPTAGRRSVELEGLAGLLASLAVSVREAAYQGHDALALAHVKEARLVLLENIDVVKRLQRLDAEAGRSA